MRMMMLVQFPIEPFNSLVRNGSIKGKSGLDSIGKTWGKRTGACYELIPKLITGASF